jgi:hypothetical protein
MSHKVEKFLSSAICVNMKKDPNRGCILSSSHCATRYCTIDNQLLNGIDKITRGHANILVKIIIHASSRTKT